MSIKHPPFAALGNALLNAVDEQLVVAQKASRHAYFEIRDALFEQNSVMDKDIMLGVHECLFGIFQGAFTKLETNTLRRTIKDFKQWADEMEEDSYQVGDLRYPSFLQRAESDLNTRIYKWLKQIKGVAAHG